MRQGYWRGSGIEELIRSVSAIQKLDNLANNMEANTYIITMIFECIKYEWMSCSPEIHKPRLGLSDTTHNGSMEQSGKETQ